MSYYPDPRYQQPPNPHDPNRQYTQGQNGAYTGHYAPPAPVQQQYPGQPVYGQQVPGGPVQLPYGQYQEASLSPRSASFGGGGYGTQAPQTYNPQSYVQSPQLGHGQIPQYNPQDYANQNTNPYPTQFNTAALPEAPAATSGPLGDPYAYSPSNFSNPSYSPQQPTYNPPQHAQPVPHYVPAPPQHVYDYQPHAQSAPPQSAYQHPPPGGVNMPYPAHDPYAQPARRQNSVQLPQRGHMNISPALPGLSGGGGDWAPSPPGYSTESLHSPSPLYHTDSHGSAPSPQSTTPGPTPPAHGSVSRSNTLDYHPQQRPLPGRPDPGRDQSYFQVQRHMSREEEEMRVQDSLYDEVENELLGPGRTGRSPSISLTTAPYQPPDMPTSLFSPSSPNDHRASNGSAMNGHLSPSNSQRRQPEAQYSDESDAEAAAGLEAMRLADERDAVEHTHRQSGGSSMRFGGYNSQRNSQRSMHSQHHNGLDDDDDLENEDYTGVDVSNFGGGYDVHVAYGGDPAQLAAGGEVNGDGYGQYIPSQNSSMRRSRNSQASSYDYAMDNIHPFPPFRDARVEVGGTGGNYVPPADGRRQSFDEGDEYTLMEGAAPERFPDEPPDIFFHSAAATYRPLPPPPGDEYAPSLHTELKGNLPPYAPDGYGLNAQGQWVPRSTSLISHSNTPQVPQPLRSKTDAEERKLRQSYRGSAYSTYDSTPTSSAIAIDLPSLPTKRFTPSKLGASDFKKCDAPWALSAVLSWLILVTTPDQTTELKESAIKEALVNLFTNKVPTMNIADAEGLSTRVVTNMYKAGTLQPTEEWVRLVDAPMTGVIFQLTGSGCYAPTLHDHVVPGRCYSHHCQRTLKKVNLAGQPVRTTEAWAEFYKLKKEDVEGRDKKEVERQNVLHEVVQTEDIYMEQLNLLKAIYRDPLVRTEPSIITPKRKDKFIKDVFGKLEAVKQANEDHLLPQLKYRQQEQGPWIVGFSDIFRQWIRKAKTAYIDYAGSFPGATFLVRQEMERNIQFSAFLDRARNDARSKKLGWDTYLKSPITRLQRYTLLLQTVLKAMKEDSEEKTNLQTAFDEVKAVTMECDGRVAEMQRKVDLADLSTKLVLRPGMQTAVELNLNHLGRELVFRGDLQRMGGNRFTWLDSHALLFDHYLVLAKTVAQRADQGGRLEKYDVSRLPIPMDLLVLESTNDAAMQKSSYMKGITTVTAVSGRGTTAGDPLAMARTITGGTPTPLQHINTSSSTSNLPTLSSTDSGKDSDKILYPFRIKHLGRETYTLFAHTEQARRDWCNKITEAKTKHAKALFAQHAEPFRLRVMADSAFVYDAFAGSAAAKTVVIKGTPVDRAIKEVEHRFKETGRPGPICRARVNCATSFTTPHPSKSMVAVGTDFGVFVSEVDNPRGWSKAISMTKVTQIAVLEDFNLFLLISDKSLVAYHLDVILNSGGGSLSTGDSARKAPQKLSGSRDVGFFVTGRMKDRTLVFYKKRDNLSSTFKVLEPIYQKSSEKKRGIMRRGTTEFFREFDEFYIPTECTGINLFHSSLAVSTARGFEVLTLERKIPQTVPETVGDSVQNIIRHIKDQRALCMLRLSDQEFLLCYANCAVYINKHGEISRSVIMEFVGTAQSVALYGAYLILFDSDFVEIRNAQNGRLKQIIAGREVKCLDDGGSWTAGNGPANGAVANGAASPLARTVKVVMQHPELEKTQIVVELVLNEDMKE
ncbi:hypothetical protein B0A48_17155 [Cryoendolithus antarcticus]|uniref:DH domain-containing protein n=1 Tax=Cryoendolithus antarcticus TaxID=1507870 RepID=A0A1V8SD43_9PEZI|nr:hypothetical protein B0A48_17155 [Cryoendolithus antarcticus]